MVAPGNNRASGRRQICGFSAKVKAMWYPVDTGLGRCDLEACRTAIKGQRMQVLIR